MANSYITKTQLENASLDAATLESIINGSEVLNTNGLLDSRLGAHLKTLKRIITDLSELDIGEAATVLINQRLDDFQYTLSVRETLIKALIKASQKPFMIFGFGDAGACGNVANTDAQTWELSPRSELKIWNGVASAFQDLDIGTNHNLQTDNGLTVHGKELALANLCKRAYFSKQVYYCQICKAGGLVANMQPGHASGYWTQFSSNIAAATSAISGEYEKVIWISIGLNDVNNFTSDTDFKNGLISLINALKAAIPISKIFITMLIPVVAASATYNTRIREIAASRSDTYIVEDQIPFPSTFGSVPTMNDYKGNKIIVGRLFQSMFPQYVLLNPVSASQPAASFDGQFIRFSTQNQFMNVIGTVPVIGFDFIVSDPGNGIIYAIDDDINQDAYFTGSSTDPYIGGFYQLSNELYHTVGRNSGSVISGFTGASRHCRLKVEGSNLVLYNSFDGGSNWVLARTFTNAVLGKTELRIKMSSTQAVGSPNDYIFNEYWQNPN